MTLSEQGYAILKYVLDDSSLAKLRRRVEQLFDEEGDSAGMEFKQEPGCRRLANLADKGEEFLELIDHPQTVPLIAQVLGDDFKLSSLNARSINPHHQQSQPLHADMGAVADERGYWVCNTVWLLDDFTPDNGTLRIVPGSHRWGKLPQDELQELTAPYPDEVWLTGQAGDVFVMNAHAWHGGLPNNTDSPRTAVHVFYCRRDRPQQQYQKQLLRPDVQASLSPVLRHILALDDPENDRLSARPAVRSGFLK